MRGTVKEIAEKLGTDYSVTNGFIAFLANAGILKPVGTQTSPNGKGRAAFIWEIPDKLTVDMEAIARKSKESV